MSPDQRRTLETIVEISDELYRLARANGSDVLAHLLDQVRSEARGTLDASDGESGRPESAATRETGGRR